MNDEVLIEIRDLLRLIAEPHIEKRDAGQRDKLRSIAGSRKKQRACRLMDGMRSQADIVKEVTFAKGAVSTLVSELRDADLLTDNQNPELNIYIPGDFFSVD